MSVPFDLTTDGYIRATGDPKWWNRPPRWNVDLTVPEFLLREADRDVSPTDRYNHDDVDGLDNGMECGKD